MKIHEDLLIIKTGKNMTAVSTFKNFSNWITNCNLDTILNDIKQGKYEEQISKIRSLLKLDKKEEADFLKKQLDGFTTSGTFDNGRTANEIVSYSGFLILDIDNLTEQQLQHTIKTARVAPYTYACFVSPSGSGLKIIVQVDSKKEVHKEAFKQAAEYYEQALDVEIDASGSDLSRLCFMSYDPECFLKKDADFFNVVAKIKDKPTIKFVSKQYHNNPQNDFEKHLKAIEDTATDITCNYANWRDIGFAISAEFGEAGRDYFDRISRFHSSYNQKDCDEQYTKCLNANGTGISISTFYYFVKQANIDLVNETPIYALETNDIEENQKLPTFPDSLYPQLPLFLQNVVFPSESNQEKDMLLLGALTAMSACFPKLYGIYGGDKVYSNLFLFVTAPASAGKGKLKQCKKLVHPIHKALREEAKFLRNDYDSEMAIYNKDKTKDFSLVKPKSPPEKMLFIPANNSTTGLFQLMAENEDRGIIFETEGDTLSQAFKSDYGNYSDGFRKAFHHETITYYRRTDKEFVEMENPCLSAVLSGTPRQVITLMPNAENGLFSRFIFYYLDIDADWIDVFAHSSSDGIDAHYKTLGDEFYKFYNLLKLNPEIKINVSETQSKSFFNYFSKTQTKYINIQSDEYIATVRRMGLIAFRFAMIFTALRIMEDGDITKERECSDIDFNNAIEMVTVLIKHSSKVFSTLPTDNKTIKFKNKKEMFLENLPYQFSRQDFLDIALKLEINIKTAEGYITQFVSKGLLIRQFQNNYRNPAKKAA